jgi:hypothetical protein
VTVGAGAGAVVSAGAVPGADAGEVAGAGVGLGSVVDGCCIEGLFDLSGFKH